MSGIFCKRISIEEYSEICQRTDISPNYHPNFIDYYFGTLKKKPKIIGKYDVNGQLIAASPVLLRQVFPNALHKRLLGDKYKKMGDIGQPEMLFPVSNLNQVIILTYLSPTTSPILSRQIRHLGNWSIKSMAIAIDRKHKKLTRRKKIFFETGGVCYFMDSLEKKEFADIYIKLYCKRWGYSFYDLRFIREQIIHLYDNIFGVILFKDKEPVAAQLCYIAIGKTIYYVDFINSGVKIQKDNKISYGSIMLLLSLRKAEENALAMGKKLRYSFGYFYGKQDYKSIWTKPEATFIGF